ncbi:MAG: type II secretion system F family protein [Armatimonadetes bacterium]|nr:type II secretion system F family protein [Armatimonadota bacterium]
MPAFRYRGRTSEGNFEEGRLEATDRGDALRQLYERDFHPSGLEPVDEKLSGGRRPSKPAGRRASPPAEAPGLASLFLRVSLQTRCAFWRQMAHALKAGMTVHEGLNMVSTGFGRLSAFARDTALSTAQGATFYEVLRNRPELFSVIESAMVRAGEVNGRLDVQSERIAQHFEREMEVANSLRWRLAYMGCQWVAMFATMFVVGVVAPAIQAVGMGQKTHLLSSTLRFALPFVLIIGTLFALRGSYASIMGLRVGFDRFKLKAPVIGPLFRKVAISRYTRVLSDLLAAGVPAGEAASVAAPACGNLAMTLNLEGIPAQLRGGTTLTEALLATGEFPVQVTQMVRTGEHSGTVDQLLDRVATYYEQEAVAATQTLVVVGSVAGLMVFAVAVLIYALRFYSGMMNNGILGDLLK